MFEFNGKQYSLDQLQAIANEKGYTFEELLSKNPTIKEIKQESPVGGFFGEEVKTNAVVGPVANATAKQGVATDTVLGSGNTSSALQDSDTELKKPTLDQFEKMSLDQKRKLNFSDRQRLTAERDLKAKNSRQLDKTKEASVKKISTDQALFNFEQRTGQKASSIMDLTDSDYGAPPQLQKFKPVDKLETYKRNRNRLNELQLEKDKLRKKAEVTSYETMDPMESVNYVKKTMKDFDETVANEVKVMNLNPDFKLRNDAIIQLSRNSNNNRATGDVASDLSSEAGVLNLFKGKSYYKNLESTETIKLNDEVEDAVINNLDERSLQKLAGGFYTLQEKENLINNVKIPLIKEKEKEISTAVEKLTIETESKMYNYSKEINNINALIKDVVSGKQKDEQGRYILNEEDSSAYNILVSKYENTNSKIRSTAENYDYFKKDAANKFNSYQGELGVDLAKQTMNNNFKLSSDADSFREKYAGDGFWNATKDIVGGDLVQGLYQTVKKATVGSGSWVLSSFGDMFQDQDNYSSFDAFRDIVGNWTNNTMVPQSTDEKFSITKEEGGFKGFEARNYAKLGVSMVPFTGYLISEVRKGNYTGLKDALGKTYINLGAKGKVLPQASQKLKDNIIMVDATFRATIIDNQKQAELLGLNGLQATAYATAISSTEALVQSIMPDAQFLKGVGGKTIKEAFAGTLKTAANKEGVKSAVKEFSTGILKEYAEEEITLGANILTDASFGLALPKASEFLNQQIELTMGTLMLSGSMGTVGAKNTFSNQKKLIYNQISENINGLELHLMTMYKYTKDSESKEKINDAIVFSRDIKKAIESSPENVTSEQIDLLVEKSKLIQEKEKTDPAFYSEIDEKINKIDKDIKQGGVKRDILSKIEKDIENVQKNAAKIGVNIGEVIALEDDVNESSADKMKKILLDSGLSEERSEESKGNLGVFITNKEGKEILVINKTVAIKESVVTTGQHEFLHKLLRYNFAEDSKSLNEGVELLKNVIQSLPESQGVEFKDRLSSYEKDYEDKKITKDNFYEEYITLFSEALSREDVKPDKSTYTKIKDYFRRQFQDVGLIKIKFNESENSVVNFIEDYNKAFQKGKIGKEFVIKKSANVDEKIAKQTISESKSIADIETKIEDLTDRYYNGEMDDIEYEQELGNLESKLEAAKRAPIEEKVVSKPSTLDNKNNTEEVIKKASEKVFKETEVSDKNKDISKKNEDISNEILELKANSVSDIKDPEKRKAIVNRLGENNLGAVTNLAKKAAAVGKDLAIDSGLKVGYDEFFSGFSEELSALINTYKVLVDGKKVPFGAYMKKNLSLRYGQILDKALKGKIQNTQSLDLEAGSVGSTRELADEGSRDFDAYTSAERGLPAGELIDVTTFNNVKDKIGTIKDIVKTENIDIANLTYKKVVDQYAGPVGAAILGVYSTDPNNAFDVDMNKKLAERIDGTRTLNYGKDTGGEAEVRAMQKLFLNYNDAVKFIKTIPEFNIAPFETTVDKQGKSIDLTTDAKGYSVGTSSVLLNQLYDVYVDPKSKSSDKDVKNRAITSPSGRGKGKTSQVAKVYRLKDKYRGRVSKEAVKELQKTIGITEAGEAFIPMKGVNRTKFGTALQGLTKIYAANVANTIIRKDIVEKGITSDKKPTEKVLADIGGGKSRVMFSKNAKKSYETSLAKNRPSMKDAAGQVDKLFLWVDNLNVPKNKKSKFEKLAFYYMNNGFVILPEDGYKVIQAERISSIKKIDPYSYKNPNEILEQFSGEIKPMKINPDEVNSFSNKKVLENGLVVYDVKDDKQGQLDVRAAVDSTWGVKSNPWCLIARTIKSKDSLNQKILDLWGEQGVGWYDFEDFSSIKEARKAASKYEKSGEYEKITVTSEVEYDESSKQFISLDSLNKEKAKLKELGFMFKPVVELPGLQTKLGKVYILTYYKEESGTVVMRRDFNKSKKHPIKNVFFKEKETEAKSILSNLNELDNSFRLFESYNSDGNGYKIAFTPNNKLVSLRDGNDKFWWDRMDAAFKNTDELIEANYTDKKGDIKFSKNLEVRFSKAFDKSDVKILTNTVNNQLLSDETKEALSSVIEEGNSNIIDVLKAIDQIAKVEITEKDRREFQAESVNNLVSSYRPSDQSIILKAFSNYRDTYIKEYERFGLSVVYSDLKSNLSKTNSSDENRAELIKEFLYFASRSAKSSKLEKVPSNYDFFNKYIKPIKIAVDLGFKVKREDGKSFIYYKDELLRGMLDITNEIKKTGFTPATVIEIEAQAAASVNYIIKAISDQNGDINKIKSVIAFLSLDQRGPIRKLSKPGAQMQGVKPKDMYLEHATTVLKIKKQLLEFGEKGNEASLRSYLKGVYVNLISKELNSVLSKSNLQEADASRYSNTEAQSIISKAIKENKILQIAPVNTGLGKYNEEVNSDARFSKNLSREFNKIIENKTGILATETISEVKAKMIADSQRRFNIFIPPSAEDFVGLLYYTLGKGKIGDQQMQFYKRTLLDPYARANQAISRDRNAFGRRFKEIKKEFKVTPKDLKEKTPDGLFTREQAARVWIWNSIGIEAPGLSKTDISELVKYVDADANLSEFAAQVMRLNPGKKYLSPSDTWITGNITTDLLEVLNTTRRKMHLEQWQKNVDAIFSVENLNKLEASYGTQYRKAMENTLRRMKTGKNRDYGTDTLTGRVTDWVNGSVGAIMFLNTRSAVLQTISAINFINFTDNNVLAAGKALANQKQYWSDFSTLFKSEYLIDRRDGLKVNVNEADIADIAKEKGARGALNYLLKLGFTPTQVADSFAIASGGSTFYRNRINSLIKKGMDPLAAEKLAMRDFIETAEESQQSSRPDKISQQQAGPLGRIILAFANTPAQYARLIKKAASDLKNGRGDAKSNISKILYYGVVQNIIFTTLQQAVFAMTFGDEEEEDKKTVDVVNSMIDGIARGTGIGGAIFSVVKNTALKLYRDSEKKNPKYEDGFLELLKIAPPISSKIQKFRAAGRTMSWEMDEIKEQGVSLSSPAVKAGGKVVSAAFNFPSDRIIQKVENLVDASNSEIETYKRLALIGGWSAWELDIKKEEEKKKKKTKNNLNLKTKIER